MVPLNRILCPTDFSELADHATAYACSLADAFKSELHVLHVVDESYQYWMAMGPNSLPLGPTPEEILVGAREQMERTKRDRFSKVAGEVVVDVIIGRPFVEIIRYARDRKMDLIVMGTHGRSGLTHVLLGSVTEKIVRKAPCPVLTVRAPGHKFVMP